VSGGAWPLPPLGLGDSAPGFVAASRSTPRFHFSTLPGRYVVLAFLPDDRTAWASALSAFERRQARFDGLERLCLFLVKAPDGPDVPADVMPGQRWFFDPDGEVARLYGALDDAGTERPFWLLVDPMLRVMDKAPLDGRRRSGRGWTPCRPRTSTPAFRSSRRWPSCRGRSSPTSAGG
jgi:hypothetical protein